MQKTIYIFERGIMGWESIIGDWKSWPNMACAWIHNHTEHRAQTLTYFTGPVLAGITRSRRAKQFARLLKAYKGWRVIGVAHSEGTATFLRALRFAGWPMVEQLHLICGAADSDFHNNGLNLSLLTSRVGKVFTYVAGKDKAMKLENSYIGSLCFGLQTAGQPLGLNGPTRVAAGARSFVVEQRWNDYGHSTCFEKKHFDGTMKQIVSAG